MSALLVVSCIHSFSRSIILQATCQRRHYIASNLSKAVQMKQSVRGLYQSVGGAEPARTHGLPRHDGPDDQQRGPHARRAAAAPGGGAEGCGVHAARPDRAENHAISGAAAGAAGRGGRPSGRRGPQSRALGVARGGRTAGGPQRGAWARLRALSGRGCAKTANSAPKFAGAKR